MLWAISRKIDMVGYPGDYLDFSDILVKQQDSHRIRKGMDELISSLRPRIEDMTAQGRDTVYAGHRDEFLEIYYDLILESGSRVGQPGFPASLVNDQLKWLQPFVEDDPLFQLLSLRVSTGSNDSLPIELVRSAAHRIYGSPTLALGVAEILVGNSYINEAIDVMQRVLTRHPDFPLLSLYLGKAELMTQPQHVDSAERHLRYALENSESILPGNPEGRETLLQWTKQVLSRIAQSRNNG
ncbi:hypothetical protein KQI65_07565 [bacterium]|nr:hypothetical protein [bacterium]